MIELLNIAEEATATQGQFSLVSIDLNTIVFTLINTLIIFLIYFFFLHKPVCKILDQRAEMVNKEMDEAEKAKNEADAVKAEYEQRLQESMEEANRIVAEATRKAQAREAEIVAEANNEAAEMKKRAEEAIEKEKKRAINEIKGEISEMVVMAASKVAEKEISEKDNEKIIDTVLSQIGEND